MTPSGTDSHARVRSPDGISRWLRDIAPGFALALTVSVLAFAIQPWIAKIAALPTMVIALIVGFVFHRLSERTIFQPGLAFCVRVILRAAVALLGLRIAFGDIVALGWGPAVIVIAGMMLTILSGVALARMLGQHAAYGILAGASTAVCGASAALATSSVLPNYPDKEADVIFVVIAVNALSTLAMLAYPLICVWFGFGPQATGILLGATIHDVAQVAGAGYSVSEAVGNTAIVVKLFRVFMLVPIVLGIGLWTAQARGTGKRIAFTLPDFAVVFVILCIVNSAMPSLPSILPFYLPVKSVLTEVSTWGLLIAISALGLGSSLSAIARLSWRHVVIITGATAVILIVSLLGLMI